MWSERKRKLYQKKYHMEYYKNNQEEIKSQVREWYRRTHITVAEKRECYATGNYEKAIEELKKKKWIK